MRRGAKKQTVQGAQLQITNKTMYLHKTTHLDRQQHTPRANKHARMRAHPHTHITSCRQNCIAGGENLGVCCFHSHGLTPQPDTTFTVAANTCAKAHLFPKYPDSDSLAGSGPKLLSRLLRHAQGVIGHSILPLTHDPQGNQHSCQP